MHITEMLIEKFLAGRCTKAEADAVFLYFRKNPEVWKKYLGNSWDDADDGSELPAGYKELMLEEIRKKSFARNKSRNFFRIGLRIAAAAASVMLVFWGIRQTNTHDSQKGTIAVSTLPLNNSAERKQIGEGASEWVLNTNRTDQKLKLKLEDGSVVTLLPRSSIRHARHFVGNRDNKRDVYLQGQAFFDVTRDKKRPFTVYAGNMSTTVLGTSFSVQESDVGVLVKLYSGKVMVHTGTHHAGAREIVLSPGEELRYDSGENLATVSHFTIEKPVRKIQNASSPDDNRELTFDNAALADVINKLSSHYHTPIVYEKAELSDMYFSGQVLESDSLSVILKVIANMNGLQITQTNEGFMVQPSK